MKKWYVISTVILFVWLLFFGLWSVFDEDPTVSTSENRTLQQRPEFSISTLFSGEYTKTFENYYADAFPFRESFVALNRRLNSIYYFSGTGSDNTLIIGFEGGAEQKGESLANHETLETQESSSSPLEAANSETPIIPEDTSPEPSAEALPTIDEPAEDTAVQTDSSIIIVGDNAMDIPTNNSAVITSYAKSLTQMKEKLGDTVTVYSLATPNSGEFYSPETFHTGSHSQKDMLDQVYAQMEGVVTVDAYSVLRKHVDEYIYFRTDHHWTALGAYYAYLAFCDSAHLDPIPLSDFKTGKYENFVGSMYTYTSAYPQSQALLDNPDTVIYYLPIVECSAKYYMDQDMTGGGIPFQVVTTNLSDSVSNKYLCFISGDTPLCVITTDVDGPSCVVIKESYGNALVPFLTSHYSTIYVVDPREFNSDGQNTFHLEPFVRDHEINDVIVINYPFMINNAYYVKKLDALMN